MPKRKASDIDADAPVTVTRRSTRNKSSTSDAGVKSEVKKDLTQASKARAANKKAAKTEDAENTIPKAPRNTASKPIKSKSETPHDGAGVTGPRYWLLKAEPESRIERGHDISFSIDDLASRTSPEPWDGIRNYAARNNLRAMKKGDLAFFYHSSCKVPAIVGVMEIVEEHSPDVTAQDSKMPYYDPKDTNPENPKWSIVKVELRRKFKVPVTLSELKEVVKTEEGQVLKSMDLLSLGRLSVGKVRKSEWEYIMGMAEKKERELEGNEV